MFYREVDSAGQGCPPLPGGVWWYEACFAHLQLSVLWKRLIFNVLWWRTISRCDMKCYTWSRESPFCGATGLFCYCMCASNCYTWKSCESITGWIVINCSNSPFPGVQPGVSQSILPLSWAQDALPFPLTHQHTVLEGGCVVRGNQAALWIRLSNIMIFPMSLLCTLHRTESSPAFPWFRRLPVYFPQYGAVAEHTVAAIMPVQVRMGHIFFIDMWFSWVNITFFI